MTTFNELKRFTGNLRSTARMPVLFMGHGSPMNGIEINAFSDSWKQVALSIPVPTAIIVVSAHWFTKGTKITAMDFPPTIHDFGGFPKPLFDVQYSAPGDALLAEETAGLLKSATVSLDHDWGLDHGAWSVLKNMYPRADIPVLQLSIDYTKDARHHYQLAQELSSLRQKGVLILGSGNMVHNLRMLDWQMMDGGGYDWALELDERFKNLILSRDHQPLINYGSLGSAALLAIPTPEHYLPLMYTLGLQRSDEQAVLFNDKAIGGSLTMTSVHVG